MPLHLYYCDHYEIPLPPGHKFPMRKYCMLRETLEVHNGLFDFSPAPLATEAEVCAIHDRDYVRRFLSGSLEPTAIRRIGFPWSEGLVKRTMASVGGTLAATRTALERGIGGVLAGGTHHAFRGEGSGFCVFNDIAVAIASLRERGVSRVSVIDLDVHQGDGTAKIFEDDPAVLTMSIHGRNNFPFRKQKSQVDVELEDGASDDRFLESVNEVLPVAFEFKPEVVFYQSGVDALAGDKLGRLGVTHEGLLERDRRVFEHARRAGVPCVITLGGGYADPIELTVEAHAGTFRTAQAIFK